MIYTSYFANIKNLPENLRLVSIARSTPKYVNCEKCQELFPDWGIINLVKSNLCKESEEKYTEVYKKQLEKLDAEEIANKLQNSILLCYEKPGDFCHRHLVAKWLRESGISCIEYKKRNI